MATSKNNKEREDAKKVAKEVNHILGLVTINTTNLTIQRQTTSRIRLTHHIRHSSSTWQTFKKNT
jgi:hypothetical protein